jgi:hypothetical protein
MRGLDTNGEAAGVLFFLFLSAFGFFFSRLLLNRPFAISSSLWWVFAYACPLSLYVQWCREKLTIE